MAEILVKAQDVTHPDPTKDRRGCYKKGYCVSVKPDGIKWGSEIKLPKFVVIKIPGIDREVLQKYCQHEMDDASTDENRIVHRRRLWRIRWDDLPQPLKNKLKNNGELTIKAGSYDGSYDETWANFKSYIRNQKTDTDETIEL